MAMQTDDLYRKRLGRILKAAALEKPGDRRESPF
jgi:hypothetical protein